MDIIYWSFLFYRTYIIIKRANISFDSYGHLYYTKCVKEQMTGPFGAIKPNVVSAKYLAHPFLYHWILSILPTNFLFSINKKINPVLDGLFACFIVFISYSILYDWNLSYLIGLTYITTPMWFSSISLGPRIDSFTPRIISEIFTNLYFIALFMPISISIYIRFPMAILIGSLVVLSSKFGLQAIAFLSILSSFFLFSPSPILILISTIIFSILISGGKYLYALKEQYYHLKMYFFQNLKKKVITSVKNSISVLIVKNTNDSNIKWFGKVCMRMMSINSFTSVVIKMPIIVFFIYLGTKIIYSNSFNSVDKTFGILVFSAIILFLIINIPYFLFLGEAERYLNHLSFFIVYCVVVWTYRVDMLWINYMLIFYGVLFFFIEWFVLKGKTHRENDLLKENDTNSIIRYLREQRNRNIILCYPYHAIGIWRIMYETNHLVVYPYLFKDKWAEKFYKKYDDKYPYAKLSQVDEMAHDFNLNLIIALKSTDLSELTRNENWPQLDITNDTFKVFQKIN